MQKEGVNQIKKMAVHIQSLRDHCSWVTFPTYYNVLTKKTNKKELKLLENKETLVSRKFTTNSSILQKMKNSIGYRHYQWKKEKKGFEYIPFPINNYPYDRKK